MMDARRLLAVVIAGLVLLSGCAAPQSSTSSGPGPQGGGTTSARPAGQAKTLTVAVTNNVDAMAIVGSSTTSGGWQSLNELHSQGLVTADRQVQTPVPRLATTVPSLDNGLLQLLPDGRERSTYPLRRDAT